MEPTETTTPATAAPLEGPSAQDTALARSSATQTSGQAALQQVREFLANMFVYVKGFFAEYQDILKNVGLVLLVLIALYLLAAVLDAVHDLPLLAPFFELVGIGYAIWFGYRYLWEASRREELRKDFQSFVDRVIGPPQA